MAVDPSLLEQFNTLGAQSTEGMIATLSETFGDDVTLASSLGAEDQVLTDMILKVRPSTPIFVLDTGRLNQETYDVMGETMSKYGMKYTVMFPDALDVEAMVSTHGPNLFYASVENRKLCCHVRKVAPLRRALVGKKAWITGQRRAQSANRATLPFAEWDTAHDCLKLNPLAAWSHDEVWMYLKTHQVPTNGLHAQGYPSIGCACCTRAIEPGGDPRSGRWWWESDSQKECGLHPTKLK